MGEMDKIILGSSILVMKFYILAKSDAAIF
jgi:hypothetical protein